MARRATDRADDADRADETDRADDADQDEDDDRSGGAPDENGELPYVNAVEAIQRATELVSQLTRRATEGVVSMKETDDGGWCIGVEVVETRRIPDSADILAVYEAEIDGYLELVGFRRTKRYPRGRGDQ